MNSRDAWARRALAGLLGSALLGCGGGGSEPALELGSGSAANEARGQGVAAVGAALVNAQVQIRCAAGTPLALTTDANGTFDFPADKQQLPCAVRVSGGTAGGAPNTQTLHSVFYTFGRVNLTPLTDLLVARLGAEDPSAFFDGFTSGQRAAKVSAATASAASGELQQYLAALGVNTAALAGFDLITGSFKPVAGDAHDDLLEAYAGRLAANALTQNAARAAVASFTLPGPCSAASGFCWPVNAYKLLAEGRVNEKGEPEGKFHEHDVDLAINADGSWSKSVALKSDKVGKIFNYDADIAARGLRFTGKYRAAAPGDCGYAMPAGSTCFEALQASLVMICGAAAGDDFLLLPAATVQKDSAAELKKESASSLHGQVFERVLACGRTGSKFRIDAGGAVSDDSDATVSGAIAGHIGKDWSAKKIERKFWKLTSGTRTQYVGVETGSKNGQPHFVALVSQ
jgi:hypothetical protein